MIVRSRLILLFLFLGLGIQLVLADDSVTTILDEDIRKMRVKHLKVFLKERGVECEGCVEKGHLVSKAIESKDLPVLETEAEPEPEAAADASDDSTSTNEEEDTNNEAHDDETAAQQTKEEKTKQKAKTNENKNKKGKKGKKGKDKKGKKDTKDKKDKKNKKPRETFSSLWSKQGEKMCRSMAKKRSDEEKAVCPLLAASIKEEYGRYENMMQNINFNDFGAGGRFNTGGLGGIFGGGRNGGSSIKSNSMKAPYKEAGVRVLKNVVKSAFRAALEPDDASQTTVEGETQSVAFDDAEVETEADEAEAIGTDDTAADSDTGDAGEGEGEAVDKKPQEPEKPKTLQEKISAIVTSDAIDWVLATMLENKEKVAFMGMDMDELKKNGYKAPPPTASSKPTAQPTREPYVPKPRRQRDLPQEEPEEEIIDLD